MADNEIRNPAKAYFKWKMPVITKSEDDWNFWNTEDKYNRTMFIGYNDTTTPPVASLFMIVDGKPMQAVGDDIIARIAGLETNTAQALADIQVLIDRVNTQQLEISNLQQECQRILTQAANAVDDAHTWAEGTDEEVADLGGEHSAKGWAQKANDIVASGLPADATFDHLTVTGSSKFGQDPDRANQPGLEIEGTGEIQAYRTVNMMKGATVSYDETVEMPWSDSSNKVPNTAWVQDAIVHGSGVDPNADITCQNITVKKNITLGTYDVVGYSITTEQETVDGNVGAALRIKHRAVSSTKPLQLRSSFPGGNSYGELNMFGNTIKLYGYDSGLNTKQLGLTIGNSRANPFYAPEAWAQASKAEMGSIVTGLPFVINGGSLFLYSEHSKPDAVLCALGGTTTGVGEVNGYTDYAMLFQRKSGKHEIDFGITPTVPDITDTADSSSKVPNTKWVQAAIAAGGGGSGGGAVTSVNGKTGEVVLAASDVGAATTADITTSLEPYAKTADVTTTLADYAKSADVTAEITTATAGLQPKLTAGANITISEDNVISATGGGSGGGAVDSVNGKTGAVVLTGEDIRTSSNPESATIATTFASFAQMIETKQDKITDTTALTVGSITAGTTNSGLNASEYSMMYTSNGHDKLFVDASGPYVSNLVGGDMQADTGTFNWHINTTTDYNKFNVFNRYYVTDAETQEVTTHDTSVLSIGGSPTDHSTWIDFTANYMSFKGDANFGETGKNHVMNFNGPSTFNNEANFHGSTSINGNATFWKSDAGGSLTTGASYDASTGNFTINYLSSTDDRNGMNKIKIIADSRKEDYGAKFSLPVIVSDSHFMRTSTLAASDNSTEVPTTAWVKTAITDSISGISNLLDYTTNRILEIPQDIKLELNNGTLTLKAGSKLYCPNGSFTPITTNMDFTLAMTGVTGQRMVFVTIAQSLTAASSVVGINGTNIFSGATAPTVTVQKAYWYDTTNNIIKRTQDTGATWNTVPGAYFCLPVCLATASSGTVTSIDQIFNGLGYIGSTVFALPGVQVQTPNGRNADGTYKSVIRTVDSVKTYNAGEWGTRNLNIQFSGSSANIYFEGQAVERYTYNKQFSSDTTTYSYDENTGMWWYSPDQSSWVKSSINILGSCRVESGKITSFEPYTVDSLLNSSLSNLSAAGQAKFDAKANVSNTVTTDTSQTISGVKTFAANTIVKGNGANNGTLTIKNDVTDYGTSAVDLVVATSNKKNQFLVHFQEGNKWCAVFEQNPSTKNITFSLQGCEKVLVPTPATTANDNQPATTAWVRKVAGSPSKNASVTTAFSGSVTSQTYTIYKNGNLWSIHVTVTLNTITLDNSTTELLAFLSSIKNDADLTKLLAGQVLFMNAYISGCTMAAQPGYYAIGVTAIRMENGDLKAKVRSFDSEVTDIPAGLELSFDLTTWVSN